jgi:hypothetical protein
MALLDFGFTAALKDFLAALFIGFEDFRIERHGWSWSSLGELSAVPSSTFPTLPTARNRRRFIHCSF